jgi:hypothetical protein
MKNVRHVKDLGDLAKIKATKKAMSIHENEEFLESA